VITNPYADDSIAPLERFVRDPFPFWAHLREHHPVWQHPETGVFHITRYRDVVAVFADSESWSNAGYAKTLGRVFGPTMLQMDGRDHVVRRSIIAPEVVGNRLAGYRTMIERNTALLIDRLRGRGRADLVGEFSTWLPVNVIVDMLGLPRDDLERFHHWYQVMMAGLSHYDPAKIQAGVDAATAFADYCAPVVEARRREPGTDFISRILTAEVDGERLGDDEIRAFLALLLTAGGETTDKAIGNMWANLVSDPEQLAAVRHDPALLDDAFGETMRHSFPVLGQQRTAVAPVEIAGTTIPGGAVVNISIGSANNDPEVFTEPLRYDLFRTDLWKAKELRKGYDDGERVGHLGFGLGKHFCLGYEMARLEAVVSGEMLLDAFPDLRLEPGAEIHQIIRGSTRSAPEVPVHL
jgi:pulcherriminic acid synthase